MASLDFLDEYDKRIQSFISRRLLSETSCTAEKYESCFKRCPPMIPGPPPPPVPDFNALQYPYCLGHSSNWSCFDTSAGPNITGRNPRFEKPRPTPSQKKESEIALATSIPIFAALIILVVALIIIRKRQQAAKSKVDNTYNLGYLSKPSGPAWMESDGTEGAAEDGSEIFYQVDRSALAAGMNGGMRSIPDVIQHYQGTLRRSSSTASQTPLIQSPVMSNRLGGPVRNGGRNYSGSNDGGIDRTDGEVSQINAKPVRSGYMTYSPHHTRSQPALYRTQSSEPTSNFISPKDPRKDAGNEDIIKPGVSRKLTGAPVQRSDSTLNRQADRINYKNNWENFDEITATMKRSKAGQNRELVLGTESFIDPFTTPEPEEATTVDQLGQPNRNPFLIGFYDDESDSPSHQETHKEPPPYKVALSRSSSSGSRTENLPSYDSASSRRVRQKSGPKPMEPPIEENEQQETSTPTVSARNSKRADYDSEASIEV